MAHGECTKDENDRKAECWAFAERASSRNHVELDGFIILLVGTFAGYFHIL